MARFDFKLAKKLQRVEIIRSHELIDREISAFVPDEDDFDDLEIEEEPEEEEIIEEEPEPVPADLKFFDYYTITNPGAPVQISLDKIPEESMLLDDVKKEVQHAYDRGFDDAQQVTTNTFETQIIKHQEQILKFDKVIAELKEQYHGDLDALEKSIITLSSLVAGHILEREINEDDNIVIGQVKKAFRELDNEKVFRIRINPDNVSTLKEVRITLEADNSIMKNIEIIPDNSIDKGGCILETSAGMIDGKISTQLEKLHQKLSGVPINNHRLDTQAHDESAISVDSIKEDELTNPENPENNSADQIYSDDGENIQETEE